MTRKDLVVLGSVMLVAACGAGATAPVPEHDELEPAMAVGSNVVRKELPAEDPGPPFYARATTILQELFRVDGWLVIPFYREPACVPDGFNLLQLYDAPGPGGPGAFACPLVVSGSLTIEADAPLGTFPRQVVMTGDAVPFWFIRWDDFVAASADGTFTMAELRSLEPIRGTASRFHETLMPRMDDHRIIIQAAGALDDGRSFRFGVVHIQDVTKSIELQLR